MNRLAVALSLFDAPVYNGLFALLLVRPVISSIPVIYQSTWSRSTGQVLAV